MEGPDPRHWGLASVSTQYWSSKPLSANQQGDTRRKEPAALSMICRRFSYARLFGSFARHLYLFPPFTCPSSQPLSLEGFGVILKGYSCLAPRPAPPRLVPHRGLPHIYQGITGPSPEEYLAWPWGKLQWHRRSNRHSRHRAATQGAAPRRSSQPARYDPGMGRPIAFHPRGCIITRSQGTRSA